MIQREREREIDLRLIELEEFGNYDRNIAAGRNERNSEELAEMRFELNFLAKKTSAGANLGGSHENTLYQSPALNRLELLYLSKHFSFSREVAAMASSAIPYLNYLIIGPLAFGLIIFGFFFFFN